jgi:hypothetical protein
MEETIARVKSETGGALVSSLLISAFLCASAVNRYLESSNRRGAEERRDTQRRFRLRHLLRDGSTLNSNRRGVARVAVRQDSDRTNARRQIAG